MRMTCVHMQGNAESLHANIDRAYDKENGFSTLKKPFKIELQKTDVVISYRAHYITVSM